MVLARAALALVIPACSFVAAPAYAQNFPNRPVTITLAFPPGGVADNVARRLHQKVSDNVKQPVIIDYKPGGGGTIGAAAAKAAAPDGYTLLLANNSILAINPSLMDKVPYDPVKDFAPVTMLVSVSHILVVPKTSTIASVDELIARAKSSEKGLSYASQGVGGGGHLLGEMLRVKTGAKLTHVPYRGAALAMQDVLAGHVDLYFDAVSNVAPHLAAGNVRALATTASRRLAQFPNLSTMSELGHADIQADAWFALLAPAGTPQSVVAVLNVEFGKALRDETIAKSLRDMGLDVIPGSPEALGQTLSADLARFGKLIREIGARSN
jgi:tripartite-type tricarboxylate transporter receptor subunit TctC